MIKLKDGPAARAYATKLAPDFLRAVVAADGGLDVLDLPSDAPVDGETVYVYRRVSDVSQVHISGVHLRGFFSSADYEFMPEVDGESLRDNREWRRWLGGQGEAAGPKSLETHEATCRVPFGSFVCPFCQRTDFATPQALGAHKRYKHPGGVS